MASERMVRSRVRQRRLESQKSAAPDAIGQTQNEQRRPSDSSGASQSRFAVQNSQLQTVTAEVVTEISEDTRVALKKRRKKLKELKKASTSHSATDQLYELEVIHQDIENGSPYLSPSSPPYGESTRLLPKVSSRRQGIDNEAWCNYDETSAGASDLDSSRSLPYRKLSPLNLTSNLSDVSEVQQSPSRIARRERRRAKHKNVGFKSTKESSSLFSDESNAVNEEEAYEFFTHVWDDGEEDEGESMKNVSQSAVSPAKETRGLIEGQSPEEEQGDAEVLLRSNFFEKELCVTKYEKPQHVPRSVTWKREQSILFRPTFKRVPADQKIPPGSEPLKLMEEGTLLENVPSVSARNINVLENRLIQEKAYHWFGKDGKLKVLPEPSWTYSSEESIVEENSIPVVYIKPELDISTQRLNGGKTYQLDLDLSSITFAHHPLFSKEHVIASRLMQMCEKFIAFTQLNLVEVLKEKLKNLRLSLKKLKQAERLLGATNTPEHKSRHRSYIKEIRHMRRMRDMQEAEQNLLLEKIVSAWNELKALRENQGFASTAIRVEITEDDADEAAEKEEWEREISEEFEEEKEEFEAEHESALEQYKIALAQWKEWNRAVKQATKRQKQRDNSRSPKDPHVAEELEATRSEDEEILNQTPQKKPQPPPKFDSKAAFDKITANAVKFRREPGTPRVTVSVEYDSPVTPADQCPKSESSRRKDVSKTKLHFLIMYNGKKVSETVEKSLTQDFHAFWGQIYKIRIIHFPQSVKLEVYETGRAEKCLLADVYIPIPDCNLTALSYSLADHQFGSDQIVSCKHGAVGSGVLFNFENGDKSWLLTNGVVRCSLVWGVSEDGTVLAPPTAEEKTSLLNDIKMASPLSSVYFSGIRSIARLREQLQKVYLHPSDPSSEELYELIQEYGLEETESSNRETSGYFRLQSMQDDFDFVAMEEIENNKRFQILQLRNKGVAEFRNLQMVPVDSKNMSADLVEMLNKKNESVESDGGEQAKQPVHLRQKVLEEVAKRFSTAQLQRTLEDVVIEEKVPNIGTLGFSLLKVLQAKRPLYPVRKERKRVTSQAAVNTEVKIIVTVLHAINIPVRIDIDPVKERLKARGSVISEKDNVFESQVRPFVEIMFQRMAVKTNVADGPHPTWNQELILPFKADTGECNPPRLENITDVIYFNIFDEVTVDLVEDERDRDSVVHQRLERRWLGNLKIPFTTLYLNSKIEGTFHVNTPPVLLGYESEPLPWLMGGSGNDASSGNSYLSLFLTIEPCLQLPEALQEKCESSEPVKVLREVDRWQKSIIPRFPGRFIKVMAVDMSGQWIFVSRFLRSIRPPDELLIAGRESIETWELLARFVSLIPSVSDSVAYPCLCDIWSTCDQFLQLLSGDEEEHAILLCNFFLYLGKKSMLLLGSGIPEGNTAYVITWEKDSDVWVWNASSGHHFSVRDSHSPLQSVGCVISPDNVWANIQKHHHPSRMTFDLSKSSDWKPFFSSSFPNPGLKSVQPSTLTYTPIDQENASSLQEKLKYSLQENIMKWRRGYCTSWNSYCNQVLFKILTRLERNAGRTASIDSLQELEQILSSHKMSGFLLSMPYTGADEVIEAVFATGVHLTKDKNAEFSLAVYVHPYPCSVLAVWVYVAVIVSRRGPDV